jgi:diguanylate cyclase (GGDEF)-like protein/PAS domain S-box-containing protein
MKSTWKKLSISDPRFAGVMMAVILASLLAILPSFILQEDQIRAGFYDIVMPVYSLVVGGLLFLAGRHSLAYSRQMGIAWIVLSLGMFFNALGEFAWLVNFLILHQESFPVTAVAFYLFAYPLFLAGILLLPARRSTWTEHLTRLIEIAIILVTASFYLWNYLIAPLIRTSSIQDPLDLAFTLAYLICDLCLLMAILSLGIRDTLVYRKRSLVLLGLGLATIFISDVIFSYKTLQGSYQSGELEEIGWLLSYIFLGLAGASQYLSKSARTQSNQTATPFALPSEPTRLNSLLRAFLPSLILLAAYALLIQSYLGQASMSFGMIAIWNGTLVALTILLQLLYSFEHYRLNRDLHRLNRDLENRVEERTQSLAETAEALRHSEIKSRSVVEQALDGVVLTDEQGLVIEWNKQMEHISGLAAGEALGKAIWDVLFWLRPNGLKRPEMHQQLQDMIIAALSSGEAAWLGKLTETELLHPDGTATVAQTMMYPIKTERGFMIGSVSRDVTDLKQAQDVLKLSEMRLNSLMALSQKAHGLNEQEIVQTAIEEAIRLTASTIGYCHFMNEDQETIELITWSQATLMECTATPEKHYPLSQAGVWADCARTKMPVIHNDYPNLANKHGLPEGHNALTRHMSVPVVENGKVYVIIGVGNKVEPYNDADVRQIQLLANDTWQIVRRKRAEELLSQSEERYRTIVANIPGVVYRCKVDLPWEMLYISPEIQRLSGYPASDFLEGKRHYADIVMAEDLGPEMIGGGISSELPYAMEYRIRRANGEIRWVYEKGSPSFGPSGAPQWLDGVIIDITDRKVMEHRLEEMAITDALTGLFNRRHFYEQLENEFQRVKRYGDPLAILIYDVDSFKTINDTYGHDAGDLALQKMASTLRQVLRQVDIIGRLGGEEFGVLLPNTGLNEAVRLAERVRQCIAQMPLEAQDGRFVITISIGVAACDETVADIDVLVKHADVALYQAKEAGRNCTRKYETGLERSSN